MEDCKYMLLLPVLKPYHHLFYTLYRYWVLVLLLAEMALQMMQELTNHYPHIHLSKVKMQLSQMIEPMFFSCKSPHI